METHTSVEFRLHEAQLPRGWRVQCNLAHAAGAFIEEGAGWRSIFLLSGSDVKAILAPRPILEKAMAPPAPVLLPGESHCRRSLVGCGPWGR